MKFDFPENAQKNENIKGKMLFKNCRRLIYSRINARICFENLLTQEKNYEQIQFSLLGGCEHKIYAAFSSKYCGAVKISCEQLRLYDIFGLTFKTVDINDFAVISILPELRDVQINVSGGDYNYGDLQNIGDDYSEPYDYREYAVGDSPKRINWKLSQKQNTLMVKRGSRHSENMVCLVMAKGIGKTPQILSAMAEAFVSVGEALCNEKIRFLACWYDDELISYEIENEDDFIALIPRMLKCKTANDFSVFENDDNDLPTIFITDSIDYAELAENFCESVVGAYDLSQSDCLEINI
ncbi:MAG: DUF58 domain-containing protein [Oscillospiraceae bacterium]